MSEEKPDRKLYYFSLRWSVYSGLSAVTTLGIIAPALKLFSVLVVGGYMVYLVIDIMNGAISLEENNRDIKKSVRWALVRNADEVLFFVISVIIGIFLAF